MSALLHVPVLDELLRLQLLLVGDGAGSQACGHQAQMEVAGQQEGEYSLQAVALSVMVY